MTTFKINMLRDDFPFFKAQTDIVYFDNAATTHKPQCVIDTVHNSLVHDNTNVHRSSYGLASRVTAKYENAREELASFIQVDDPQSIIWTKGTTDSLNLLAYSLRQNPSILNGTEILLLDSEHHANLLPWQQLAESLSLRVTFFNIDKSGIVDFDALLEKISNKTALIAFTHVSNALGCVFPVQKICKKAKQCQTISVVDGTQALAHFSVSMRDLGCDIYVGSGHKMFAPMGIGFAYVNPNLLAHLPPVQLGGEMVQHVTLTERTWQSGALKFEAGTPNVPGVLALATAVNYIVEHRETITEQEIVLYQYTVAKFSERPELNLLSHQTGSQEHIPLFSFTVSNVDAYDILRLLDEANIAFRVGHHCAMPLTQALGIASSCRISLCAYNTLAEVDYFFQQLDRVLAYLMDGMQAQGVQVEQIASVLNALETSPRSVTTTHKSTVASMHDEILPLASKFTPGLSYEQVLRLLMLASKACPKLEETAHIPANHVAGCEVDVWLAQEPQIGLWQGYANSKIVRGLLAVLLEKANQVPAHTLTADDFTDYLHDLGILRQLSQSRVDGLRHVIARLSA